MSLVALDTNIYGYAADLRQIDADDPKRAIAKDLIEELLAQQSLVLPAQVCVELQNLLVRKGGRSRVAAAMVVRDYLAASIVVPTDAETLAIALALSCEHDLQVFDAVILTSAARAGCEILFSEDMQDGFEWEGVRVVNPFA